MGSPFLFLVVDHSPHFHPPFCSSSRYLFIALFCKHRLSRSGITLALLHHNCLSLFSLMWPVLLLLAFVSVASAADDCRDLDNNCRDWVAGNANSCTSTDYIRKTCRRSCGQCGAVDRKYDVRRLPPLLQPLGFLVGKWRSDFGGKAIFPTIPKFTYGEEIEISIPDDALEAQKALNYTAFAWSVNEKDELHSEYGYISVKPNTREAALTTVMNNGFVTVEEGPIRSNQITFRLKDIGRISFSRDLPVHDLVREWTLLDRSTLQARLNMETLTHGMQEHTFVRYEKIEP